MTRRTKLWLPMLLAMLLVATVVVAACEMTATVTYAKGADDATGTPPAAQTVAIDEDIVIAKNTLTRTGYTFAGWSDGSKIWQPDETYTVKGDVTFTAQWTLVQGGDEHECESKCSICQGCQNLECEEEVCGQKCPGHVTISFSKAASATGSQASVTLEKGANYELPACSFQHEGMSFLGWMVDINNPILLRQPGYSMSIDKDVTLVAVFGNEYTGSLYEQTLKLTVRDDGKVKYSSADLVDYELEGTVLTFDYEGFPVAVDLNDIDHTYVELDALRSITFTTNEGGHVLSFDGKGGAMLDGHALTYTLILDDYAVVGFTVKGADADVEVMIELKNDTPVINAKITIGGVDYVFGTPAASHECESECGTCGGCLNEECQEEACREKCSCPGPHDGNYFNSKGATNIKNYVDGIATKVVIYRNKVTLYNASGAEMVTITVVWDDNVGTGMVDYFEAEITVGDEMITISFYTRYEDSFYTAGNEPEDEDPNAEKLAAYEGEWGGLLGEDYTAIKIENGQFFMEAGEWSQFEIDSVEDKDGGIFLTFKKAITPNNYKYGYATFTSATECSVEYNGMGPATFIKGAAHGVSNDRKECTNPECTCGDACTGEDCTCGNTSGGGEETGEEAVLTGSASKQISSDMVVITKITLKITGLATQIKIEGTLNSGILSETIELTDRTSLKDAWYEGNRSSEVEYYYTFEYKDFTFYVVVFNDQETVYLCESYEDLLGEFTLSSGGSEEEDDDQGGYSKNIADYEGVIWVSDGTLDFNNCNYDAVKIENGKVWLRDKGYDFNSYDSWSYSVDNSGDLLIINFGDGFEGTITINKDNTITVTAVKTGAIVGNFNESGTFTRAA